MSEIDPRYRLEQLVKEWRTTAEADFSRAHTSDPVHKFSLLAQAAGIGHCIDSLSALLASLPEGEERGWRPTPHDVALPLRVEGRHVHDAKGWIAECDDPEIAQWIVASVNAHRAMRDPQ